MLDLVALLVAAGLLGARLFYVLLNLAYFREHPLEIFAFWRGGLVFYGGFLVAAAAGVWFTRRHEYSIATVADCLAPALAVGQAVGRWGCFFAGCCYGKPTSLPWAVKFTDPASLAPLGIELHPVQLYESIGSLLIGVMLWLQVTRRNQEPGQVFWTYVLLYGSLRFALEFVRGDDRGPALGGLFPSQLIALGAVLLSASILLARLSAREKPSHG
jgi:phosphatidylglycerol:prolipoprotein diacylglycerol transferase